MLQQFASWHFRHLSILLCVIANQLHVHSWLEARRHDASVLAGVKFDSNERLAGEVKHYSGKPQHT